MHILRVFYDLDPAPKNILIFNIIIFYILYIF